MKKLKFFIVLASIMLSLSACNTKDITVSFVQEGQQTIVLTVENGEIVADIPDPVAKEGYTITWDKTDFSNITKSIVVNAVETPNVYIINYEIGNNVQMGALIQEVRYNEEFTLSVPKLDGYAFMGWKLKDTEIYVQEGKYTWLENITLVAEWDILNDNDFSFWY